MTATSAVLLGVAAMAAIANWWSRATRDRRLEYVTKPTVMVALIGALLAFHDVPRDVRPWFLAALVLSLAGDVLLMLPRDLFVPGLACFLLGHLAYIGGASALGLDAGPWLALAAVIVVTLIATAGRRAVSGARHHDRRLGAAVIVYLLAISLMALMLAATGRSLAALGAIAFVCSDTILGYDRFVVRLRAAPVAIMVTYHVAQALLVLSLA